MTRYAPFFSRKLLAGLISVSLIGVGIGAGVAHANQVSGTCDGRYWTGVTNGIPSNAPSMSSTTALNGQSTCSSARVRARYTNGNVSSWAYGTSLFASGVFGRPDNWYFAGGGHGAIRTTDQWVSLTTTIAP
jgi:hypothetical protein